MLKNVLSLDNVQILNKTEQAFIKGGELTNCYRNTEMINGNLQYVFECWDTEQDRYRRFNILGKEIACDN